MRRKQKREQVIDPVAELGKRVSQHRSALLESSLYFSLRSALLDAKTKLVRKSGVAENCVQLQWQSVCLGLGSLSDNRVSRIQFCILECSIELIGAAKDKCVLYDPQFNETDKSYLRNAGYQLIEHNEEGRHRVDLQQAGEFLFLYLPHCGTALYQNFFAENWDSAVHSTNQNEADGDAGQHDVLTTEADLCTSSLSTLTLNRTLFIGNQLTAIRDRSLDRLWLSRFPHLAYLAEHGTFECTLDYADEPHAHSDTALQLFTIEPADAEFIRLRSVRPAYDAEAVDIVLNASTSADKCTYSNNF